MKDTSKSAPPVMQLRLSVIEVDETVQPRAGGLNQAVVEEYAEAIAANSKFPPLIVYADPATEKYWLASGFHRYAAYQCAGRMTARCEVRKGGRTKAREHAAGSNAEHGLRRTNADKRRVVEMMLEDHPDWSNRQIAKVAQVTHPFVAQVKASRVVTVTTRDAPNDTAVDQVPEEDPIERPETEPEPTPEQFPVGAQAGSSEPAAAEITPGSDRLRLAGELDVLRERVEALAGKPEGADLLTTEVPGGPIVKDATGDIGAAVATAKSDTGYRPAVDRHLGEQLTEAASIYPSEPLRVLRCNWLRNVADALRRWV
jgi:uncharacterized ParB-like nuclease family protein